MESPSREVSQSCRFIRGGGTGQRPVPTAKWDTNAAQPSRGLQGRRGGVKSQEEPLGGREGPAQAAERTGRQWAPPPSVLTGLVTAAQDRQKIPALGLCLQEPGCAPKLIHEAVAF